MRGLDAGKVYEYLDLLADQIQATELELSESRSKNERLQAELLRGQAEQQRSRLELQRVQAELDHYEQAGDRVNEQVVQMFSQAQLVVEEMVQDVSRDARERIGQAREHERKIVAEAMDTAGQQVRSYAQTAQAHMQSLVDSFATEVDNLGNVVPPSPPDPLHDPAGDWRAVTRNGSRSTSPRSD
ncbi:hypothetical protein AB0P21_01535 [Kribbella sp. NPDC056861]|uniref:hypothetical protein n=1 Tax=Kribbella sp. NPDC056861 TaxID=3154857 RepID=UPI00343BEB58